MFDPELIKLSSGSGASSAVVVRGFLSDDDDRHELRKWKKSLRKAGFEGAVYALQWDALNSTVMGGVMGGGWWLGGPLLPIVMAGGALALWKTALKRSVAVGEDYLGDLLKPLAHGPVTLVGHSLGARLVWEGLRSSTLPDGLVTNAVLLGGAIDRKDKAGWSEAIGGVTGKLINVFNEQDHFVRKAFWAIELGEEACGADKVKLRHPRLRNVDASDYVEWHDYRPHLKRAAGKVLRRA